MMRLTGAARAPKFGFHMMERQVGQIVLWWMTCST